MLKVNCYKETVLQSNHSNFPRTPLKNYMVKKLLEVTT